MNSRNPNVFYHYCSNDSFYSIINNKTIRLSSLRLSNDKTEGTVISKVFEALAEDDPEKVDGFSAHIKELESRYHALGFCLSEDSDLLSQWRGYADNASGVSVGFSKKYLAEFAAQYELTGQGFSGQFSKIEYCLEKQKKLLRPLYEEMRSSAARGGMRLPSNNSELDAFSELGILGKVSLAAELYRVKDNGFSEENEWRIVVPLREVDLASYECKYRLKGDALVPYKEFPLDTSSIQDVVLGPKNRSSEEMISNFLESEGFWGVNVKKSKIPFQ